MAEYTGCDDCRHSKKDMREFPCTVCIHNAIDKFEKKTNADRIRAMSDAELAEFLIAFSVCGLCKRDLEKCYKATDCEKRMAKVTVEWLKSEVKE